MKPAPTPDDISALALAARTGNNSAIIKFAATYTTDHIDDSPNHETPLLLAIKWGQIETAKLLIDLGASLHHMSPLGETPFCESVKRGLYDLVEYMIDNGPDLGSRVYDRITNPLIISVAQGGQIGMAALLLSRGMPVDGRDVEGNTALIIAAEMGREDIVRLLLSHGADSFLLNDHGQSAMDIAMDDEFTNIGFHLIKARAKPPKKEPEKPAAGKAEEEARKKLSEDLRDTLRQKLKSKKPPKLG